MGNLLVLVVALLTPNRLFAIPTANDTFQILFNKAWTVPNFLAVYPYHDLVPICRPVVSQPLPLSFEDFLRGDRPFMTSASVAFQENISAKVLCHDFIVVPMVEKLRSLIRKGVVYDVIIGGKKAVVPLGYFDATNKRYDVVTHIDFILHAEDGRIASVTALTGQKTINLPSTTDHPIPIQMSYSVVWTDYPGGMQHPSIKSSKSFGDVDLYLMIPICNAWIVGITCIVIMMFTLLRVLRSDAPTYLKIRDPAVILGDEEMSWKLLHHDVFRSPSHRALFCAFLGSGIQLCCTCAMVFVVALVFSSMHFSKVQLFVSFFILMSILQGFTSGFMYRQLGGRDVFTNWSLTISIFTGTALVLYTLMSIAAHAMGSIATLPIGLGLEYFLAWIFGTVPLVTVGLLLGYRVFRADVSKRFFPYKANRLARGLPKTRWYRKPWLNALVCGFVPATAVCSEFHFQILTYWQIRQTPPTGSFPYAVGGMLLSAVGLSLLLTYRNLKCENYKWWWPAFLCGSSIGVYLFLGCLVVMKLSNMSGFLQIFLYMGYCGIACFGLALAMGSITLSCSFLLVRKMYQSIKPD